MGLGRGRQAVAIAVAVLGGLLGPAVPGASAAPADTPPAAGAPVRAAADTPPAVWPRPRSVETTGADVALGREVTLVAAPGADPYAVTALREVLRDAGVTTVHEALPGRGPVVRLGGDGAREALRALEAPDAGLPAGGYRLAVGRVAGRPAVALDGAGDDGLFHGVQTLRQLVRGRAVAGVLVRDWPETAVRGTTEGFYGRPWTLDERLAQLDFMGRTKQNRYLYAAGDDAYRQARWREPYPADRRAEFRAVAAKARAEHVTLGWAVSPGQAMCLASDADVRALNRKIDAMWALGVRAFQLQFQDVSYSEWHCDEDAATFGDGPAAAARAHARVAGAVAAHLTARHPGAEPLSVLPTEYYQDGSTDYRSALADALDPRVQVAWTGVGVVPRTITGGELDRALDAFRHPLVTMDNYPVNDYAQDRIFLGPYTGRDPAVAAGSAALLAHAMEQPTASRIPLFTAADFAWNPGGYRPQESWRAAVDDLAGGDERAGAALRALAGNSAGSVLGGEESAYLRPLLSAFWAGRTAGTGARDRAAAALRDAFSRMRTSPRALAGTAGGRLADEVAPWTAQLARYGRAGELAVDLLQAQARGDGAAAWRARLALEPLRERLSSSTATVGEGVLDPFLTRSVEEAGRWNGTDRDAGTVTRTVNTYTVELDRPRPVESVTVLAGPAGPDTALEARVPGEGWRRLGALSRTGWTQRPAGGVVADALRVVRTDARASLTGTAPQAATGPAGGPGVRAVVPWFGDEPAADLALVKDEADAVIGGSARVEARLAARRPDDVEGTLTVEAPAGIEVRVPSRTTTVPRGARTSVPVDITVAADTPAGSYEVPVHFGGQESTLTVRAFPRTEGPDLLRTATASSSGDETPDFPAAAASDGDPATRWSAAVADEGWWQAELARPVRLGQVVLTWQDAYASEYRVQVSSNGRTWRTAATVRDGRGGRETVRTDAPDTRFVRVRGDRRGTEYGYSLWSVEAYAVAEE